MKAANSPRVTGAMLTSDGSSITTLRAGCSSGFPSPSGEPITNSPAGMMIIRGDIEKSLLQDTLLRVLFSRAIAAKPGTKDRSPPHVRNPVFLERRTDGVVCHHVRQDVAHMRCKPLGVQPQHPFRPWSGFHVRPQLRFNWISGRPVIQEELDQRRVYLSKVLLDRLVQGANDGGTDHQLVQQHLGYFPLYAQ